ncbi:VWA domain-containing protein [Deinococcus sp. YIM 77859]|uniref:vWA domain-containing protein n=1 Tax=Deinococcus sp. YIM 77859 TaxID=1540221 RepID=UPI0005502B28|nr:VWA domain-containing protein [Deinococcus sp. YIM 77859]
MTGSLPARLSAQVSAFAGRLRDEHGFLIGPGEVADALRAVAAVNVLHVTEVRDALRAVLTSTPEQARMFDAAFDAFFRSPVGRPPALAPPPARPAAGTPRPPPRATGRETGQLLTPSADPGEEDGPAPELPSGKALEPQPAGSEGPAAPSPPLRVRLSPQAGAGTPVQAGAADLPELLRAASAVARAAELGRERRLRRQPQGPKLDARRTLREAARTAGDAAVPRWLGRPRHAPRFLLVLDGSRSMGRSAAQLLRFAFALQLRARRVEVYAFSTGLTRLTPQLRCLSPAQPLTLPDLGEAWGGGTRIGENLLRLAREERDRVHRNTVVLILSDGLDTGDPDVLARALRDLRARAGRLIWLSPLAATPGYQPVQRAVQAALPHLHAFLPAGDVADLYGLARLLRST